MFGIILYYLLIREWASLSLSFSGSDMIVIGAEMT